MPTRMISFLALFAALVIGAVLMGGGPRDGTPSGHDNHGHE